MRRQKELAATYAAARPRLVRVAYTGLGSHVEAEDVVSEVWLRLAEADTRPPILNVDGWATVTVAHRTLDVLRSARVRRESKAPPGEQDALVGSARGYSIPSHLGSKGWIAVDLAPSARPDWDGIREAQ